MGMKWTEQQQKVIDLRERNILVSAAAGSGKTAVLVERIIQMLTDTKRPVDVDSLLIVTFTEAAAAEMKERIREAIEKRVEECPKDVHLQRQATLIHSASITTIHSFCLSVIREHFHVLDIDPGFRIAEEGELKLLRQDVLDTVLEGRYGESDAGFLEIVEKFGSGKNDKRLEEIILKLYEYSRSYPQPDVWLDGCAENYRMEGETPKCVKRVEELIRFWVADMKGVIQTGLTLCNQPDGPYMYGAMLEADLEVVSQMEEASDYKRMYLVLQNISWKKLSSKKDESVDDNKRDAVKALRDKVKKMVKNIIGMYFYEEPEEIFLDMQASMPTMAIISDLVKEFGNAFSEQKRNKNLIDFNDMEQFALQILTVLQDGKLVPSLVSREYQEKFTEILIDEYQDSNLIQETILTSVSRQSRGQNNIFMVGDVKQSIYRFRLSRPELFMEKYHQYTVEDGDCQRIDLHKNFRSRTEVLDSVNFLFEHMMRQELGGILYDEEAALYPGADFRKELDETNHSYHNAELLLIDSAAEAGLEETGATEEGKFAEEQTDTSLEQGARVLEARAIARRIQELLRQGCVSDKLTKESRKPTYKDIVILTRSMKGWADVFTAVLVEEGIPAYAGSREGYFKTYEVSVLLDYLRILDNFRQEIPLCAVLTSCFVGINARELAEIKNSFIDCPFYEAVQRYANEMEPNNKLSKLLQEFLKNLDMFREQIPYMPIHDLLWNIIEGTGYGVYVAAMPGGAQREANLEMLVEKATAFESTSYKGLFNFVRYIEQLQKYEVDYGEANIADEQSDVVRIMSIHKSKGLEFPIVFVAGMTKRFNTQDVKGSLVIHPEWGVGIDAIDLDKRTKLPTLLKKVIQEEVTRENLGEELRVLYVALTRAKEKLILTGMLANAEQELAKYEAEKNASMQWGKGQNMSLPYYILADATSYMDWILPVLPLRTALIPLDIRVINRLELCVLQVLQNEAEHLAKERLLCWDTEQVYNEQLRGGLRNQLSYQYPYKQEGKLKFKFTVSELKKRVWLEEEAGAVLYEEPETVPLLPAFLQGKETLSGASRGSAYHKLLELLDFSQQYNAKTLQAVMKGLCTEGKLSEEMADCIRIADILAFLDSQSGQRMKKAATHGVLRKEQPFVLGVDASEIYPDTKSQEMLLVQGIIDVYFEEDDGLVVLDYKTDKIRTGTELKEKYHAQLDYYARALEQLLGKRVKEKIIYSFTLGEEIHIEGDSQLCGM